MCYVLCIMYQIKLNYPRRTNFVIYEYSTTLIVMDYSRHFDCLKNKLPPNWTNNNATGYYNRKFWKRCKCEYGPKNPCKATADKWNPVADEPSKWTEGCSHCSSYYNSDPSFYYSYNPRDCGDCGTKGDCRSCEKCKNKNEPCRDRLYEDRPYRDELYRDEERVYEEDSYLYKDDWGKRTDWGRYCNWTKPSCFENDKCGYAKNCDRCTDVPVIFRMVNDALDCDNIVEFKIPVGCSKEMYLAKFSPEFIEASRFQCATMPAYNSLPNNLVDNLNEEKFTPSDQMALTKRGINNYFYAQRLIDEGKLIHERQGFSIPMDVYGRSAYYYLGNYIDQAGAVTGLSNYDAYKGYFGPV